jgi:hypothetical protein
MVSETGNVDIIFRTQNHQAEAHDAILTPNASSIESTVTPSDGKEKQQQKNRIQLKHANMHTNSREIHRSPQNERNVLKLKKRHTSNKQKKREKGKKMKREREREING